jgi:hypothetical protein
VKLSFECSPRSYHIDLEKDGYGRDGEQNGFRDMHMALYRECASNQKGEVCIKFLEEGFVRGAGKCVVDGEEKYQRFVYNKDYTKRINRDDDNGIDEL